MVLKNVADCLLDQKKRSGESNEAFDIRLVQRAINISTTSKPDNKGIIQELSVYTFHDGSKINFDGLRFQ